MIKNAVLLICFVISTHLFAQQPVELEWENLVPNDFQIEAPNVEHIGQAMAGPQTINAPVVKELDGKLVKIPGFVVPLEGDETSVTEFLLVPYFGACTHVPPPPSNQIIHVTFKKGAPAEALYDPIYLIGTLSTKEWKGELAQVGYTMVATAFAPYDDF
ncbi:DUF3299 domain-containing protein [Psychrosphaera sp. B3R10]|uniref:DUF3299 domain-containing protein n=1 Tax=unclassified Psychrosphaera TaxID=2641570 RepID=UPI001C097289|nr:MULTISPECIES: DUF3299 domain-containing protein [unclassified Psychrosphaera]MBU2883406.1 DUF3299 domain-containing protein [Psychrosphaera sp. I2R16]MBU2990500.1 DUF3299 domain-containing protein [Psychrosphaera sp. B3R10]MDO6719026.1 DUF3299 domain-containing protein [Psychrosphaera sp. 1_MG-2023]